MSVVRSSRVFAVVAIAVGGLAALKTLDVADRVIDVVTLAGPAYAAGGETADPRGPLDIFEADDAGGEAEGGAAASAGSEAQVCVPGPPEEDSFAERSGLSLSELQVLRSLSQRRRDLDAREASVVEREGVLSAAEARVEDRVGELEDLQSEINRLLGQLDEAEEAQINSLVALYSRMKAADAARIFGALDHDVRIEVAARMTDQALAPVLAAMPERDAADLTVALARRHEPPDTLEALQDRAGGAD